MAAKYLDISDETDSSDDDDDDDDEEDENDSKVEEKVNVRKKRDLESSRDKRCSCPSSSGLQPWLKPGTALDPAHAGNPVYGNRMQLYCRTGFHLAILHSGKVRGSPQNFNKFAVVEVSSVAIGEVRIRAVESNLYLAMNANGRLYGENNVMEEGTIFIQSVIGQYNAYLSRKYAHMGWYVAIKKSGKPKNGKKTKWGQKAIQFLPRRL